MHLPKRARGLVLGCLMMVAGPATAVLITTPAQGAVAASASLVRSSVGEVNLLTNVTARPLMLRVRPATPFRAAPSRAQAGAGGPPPHRVARHPSFIVPSGLSVSQAQVVADITAAAERWGVSVVVDAQDRQLRIALPLELREPERPVHRGLSSS